MPPQPCIVSQVMEAYHSFCEVVHRHAEAGGLSGSMNKLAKWLHEYKKSHDPKWWLKPATEVMIMMKDHDPPLTPEDLADVSELVNCLQLYGYPAS